MIILIILGLCIGCITYKQHYDETTDADVIKATFCKAPAISGKYYNVITEVVGTFILVFDSKDIGHANVFKVQY